MFNTDFFFFNFKGTVNDFACTGGSSILTPFEGLAANYPLQSTSREAHHIKSEA